VVAGATTGAGVGLPLLLLLVALLDDLARATTAAQQPLDSVHRLVATSARVTFNANAIGSGSAGRAYRETLNHLASALTSTPFHTSSLTSLPSLPSVPSSSTLTPRALTPLIEHRSSLRVPTLTRDADEADEIATGRARAKRAAIGDGIEPNLIDSWPATWRRVAQRQPCKLESASNIDHGTGPAVRGAFTPLLEPAFKFGDSVLRPESSLRDILLREGASRTATTAATVATRTVARGIAYPDDATWRAGSSLPEGDDVEGVTEVAGGDKGERELVLVTNEGNGAVVAGSGDSVIEWTTTVAEPMSASAFSVDDVQVAERVRARASSERSSSKVEEDDDGLINATDESSTASSTTTTTTTTQRPPLTQDTSMEAREYQRLSYRGDNYAKLPLLPRKVTYLFREELTRRKVPRRWNFCEFDYNCFMCLRYN